MSVQHQLCRLCGMFKPLVKNVFSEHCLKGGTLIKIHHLFKQVLYICKTDKYSKFICSDCELSVNHFYEFREMVQNTQKNISHIQQTERFMVPAQNEEEYDLGLNLCHTTGITNDSETVLIRINSSKNIQCDVCKAFLHISQLITLYLVTHGLGTVLCQCEECGHRDDIGTFLQEKTTSNHGKNNIQCPQCMFRHSNQTKSLQTALDDHNSYLSNKRKNYESIICSKSEESGLNRNETCKKFGDTMCTYSTCGHFNEAPDSDHYSKRYSNVSCNNYEESCNLYETTKNNDENFQIINDQNITETIPRTSTNKTELKCNEDIANSNDDLKDSNNYCTNDIERNKIDNFKHNHINQNDLIVNNCKTVTLNQKNSNFKTENTEYINYDGIKPDDFNKIINKPNTSSFTMKHFILKNTRIVSNSSNSKLNQLLKNGEKRHVCKFCSQVFNHKGHLKRHFLVHNKNIKEYLCDQCGISFNQKSSLNTHLTHLHSKDKDIACEYKCVWCGQTYKHKMNLKSHLITHHPAKSSLKSKFYCNICDKYFISIYKLKFHSKIHSGNKDFQCRICNKMFSQKNNLNVHLKKHDLINVLPNPG